jgi:hypothetical protein
MLTAGLVAQDNTAPFFDHSSTPGLAEYQAAMNKYVPGLLGSPDESSGALLGWALGKMIEYAAQHGKGTTAEDLLTGLYTAKDETLAGIIAPVTYVKGETTHVLCGFLWTIKDKNYALTDKGVSPVCAPADVIVPADDALAKSLSG